MNTPEGVFAAIDIGASSGRVMAGTVVGGEVNLEQVHRFTNGAQLSQHHLRWDVSELFVQVISGLQKLADKFSNVVSIGIDTWAVDYGLLDDTGRLLAEPVSYRDSRTRAVIAEVDAKLEPGRLYSINGLQRLPFTTLYQLAAEQKGELWSRTRSAVLIPDLIGYWLTGNLRTEYTNASTTGLLDIGSGQMSAEILEELELSHNLFPPMVAPGDIVGAVLPSVARRTGLSTATKVVAVGTHDTASAVVGVPAKSKAFAYVSSGTWSLVGVELERPVLTTASRAANFTNEGGVDNRIRFLRNVGGLWLLQECLRDWNDSPDPPRQGQLLHDAALLPAGGPVIDVDDPGFIEPGHMPQRILAACARQGLPAPDGRAAVVRCILDSLAIAYARTVDQAVQLSGHPVDIIHIVGGGSRNELLCQLTADLSGRPVVAGPVEATATGNVLIQARAHRVLNGSLDILRQAISRQELRRYEPAPKRSLTTIADPKVTIR